VRGEAVEPAAVGEEAGSGAEGAGVAFCVSSGGREAETVASVGIERVGAGLGEAQAARVRNRRVDRKIEHFFIKNTSDLREKYAF